MWDLAKTHQEACGSLLNLFMRMQSAAEWLLDNDTLYALC